MGSSLELRKSSSHRHNSRIGKEGVLLSQTKRSPCPPVPEQLKMKSPVRPRTDLYCVSTKGANIAREKSSRYSQGKSVKGSPIGEDELVRHMSNLPGYLLRVERRENLQEKALNVGVLDWTRLENWKHKQIDGPTKDKDALCGGNYLSLKQTCGLSTFPRSIRSETSVRSHSSLQSGLISSHKEERSHCVTSARSASHCHDSDSGSKSAIKGQQKIQRTGTSSSSGINDSNVMHQRERTRRSNRRMSSEMVNFSSHARHSGVLPCPKRSTHVLGGKTNHRTEKLIETDIQKKEADERLVLEIGEIPSKLSNDISYSLNDRVNVENNEMKKRVGKQFSDIDLPHHYFTYKQDGNLLLKQKPKDLDEGFQPLNSRTSFDENMTDVNSCCYSEIFSPEEALSSECGSEIPYSSPLPYFADADPTMGRMQDSLVNDSSAELSRSTSQLSPYSNQKHSSRPSEGKQIENGTSDIKLNHSNLVGTLETLDDKTPESGARKGRHPSPNRRLSFSLGRMGRSFSFKESSTIPQLSSTHTIPKSGPVISENTASSDNSDRKKVIGHNRTRSSPLRRLLEPIMKHKSSNPQHPSEGNANSLSFWPTGLGSAHQKKHADSTMQALLQLTIKNGFPLFKLLVDNNRNILAATVKDLTPSGKNESGHNYTFYLVNEIKRKTGGWIRPGNKDRSYGYAYNVIGQMIVNSDYRTNEHNNGEYTLRESVLFGVDMRPGDRESAIIVKNRELAAIVLKIPIENSNHGAGEQSGNVLTEDCMKSLSEDNAVVILPGAVHGSPSSGEPSPLINRWRSGGVCDCGGWDVGCKLRILSIPKKLITSKAFPISNCLELFVQVKLQILS